MITRTVQLKRAGVALLAIAVSLPMVWALTGSSIEFHNNLETAGVNIELDDYNDKNMVSPGEMVRYIPTVTNKGEDCYIRMKMDFVSNDGSMRPIDESDYLGPDENWIKQGEYYYYRNVLSSGSKVDFFQGFRVPSQWTNESAAPFEVEVTADGIQSASVKPDFSSIGPWGTIEIQKSNYEGGAVKGIAGRSQIDKLKYTDNKTLECLTSDLFEGFDRLMPGDECTGQLPVVNDSKKRVNIYFRTDSADTPLLRKVRLQISAGDRQVYSGSLDSQDLKELQMIGSLDRGESTDLKFQLDFPEDADNSYMKLQDKVVWILQLEEVSDGDLVKTGDDSGLGIMIALAVMTLSLIAMLVLFIGRRKK